MLVDAIFNLHFHLQKGAGTLQNAGQSMFLPKSAFLALAESAKAGRRFGTGMAQIRKNSTLSPPRRPKQGKDTRDEVRRLKSGSIFTRGRKFGEKLRGRNDFNLEVILGVIFEANFHLKLEAILV